MSFKIWKASFFFLIVRLYLRFCSPFIFLLFHIRVLEKWILLLQFSFSRVNYSSLIFTISGTAIFSLIQWKAYAKTLKQQLLDVFWWYFISGVAGCKCTFLFIFALPIGTSNILNISVSSPLNLFWYSPNRNLVHVSWNFLLTNNDQDQTIVSILLIVIGSYISYSFTFPF